MPRTSTTDRELLEKTLRKQEGLIARRQTVACAMTDKAIRHRTQSGGAWRTVLPGVYLSGQAATLTDGQRAISAFLYAGRAFAVTGQAALAWHGIPAPRSAVIDVLVPVRNRRCSAGFVRLRPTAVEPGAYHQDGVVRYAPPERAIADTARWLADIADVRSVVAAGVQRDRVSLVQLSRELESGPIRGSALLRQALAEVAAGARSSAEADLIVLVRKSKLPEPLYNPRLYLGEEFLASPDAWWPQFGVAVEVDSRAWHLSPADWERTLARHARMTAQGILVLHFPPARLRRAQREVVGEITAALSRSGGPLAHIRTVPGGLAA